MKTTLTMLCDNSVSRGRVLAEHGFSVLLEQGDRCLLFDTGAGQTLPHNFPALDKDPRQVQEVLLSHGHYDHTGGLAWMGAMTPGLSVCAHPGVFDCHMARDNAAGQACREVGCPFTQGALEAQGMRFRFLEHTKEIAPGIWFLTGYARDPEKVPLDPRLVLPGEGGVVPDPIRDDASLLVFCEGGPVLLLGCAHSGVLNILDHLKRDLGIHRLAAVLGGTHLMFFPPEAVLRVIAALEDFRVTCVAVSHCTGAMASLGLFAHFKDRFAFAAAGSVFHF